MTNIFIAGHRGMVGSAIARQLQGRPDVNLITRDKNELDLIDQSAVRTFFRSNKVDQVYLAAAKVGGIHANNTYPAEFIYQNLTIQNNVIHEAWASGVKRLLFLGSSCIYPRQSSQPMHESALLTGPLEPTNEPYAIAKIAGIKMCESYNRQYANSHCTDYRSIMPTNLYGPGDNYHPENSHVIPALISRFHDAMAKKLPTVSIWGTGHARREFLYVDDMASASIFVMNLPQETYAKQTACMQGHINVGSGSDITIQELAAAIQSVVGYVGDVTFDKSRPDGAPRKLLDSSALSKLGWHASFNLQTGLEFTYSDFLQRNK